MLFPSTLSMQLKLVLFFYCSLFKQINPSFKKQRLNSSIGDFFSSPFSKAEKSPEDKFNHVQEFAQVHSPTTQCEHAMEKNLEKVLFSFKTRKKREGLICSIGRFSIPFFQKQKKKVRRTNSKAEGKESLSYSISSKLSVSRQ